MATTPVYGLPSPEITDPADGPTQIAALASQVESTLLTGNVNLTGGSLKVADGVASDDAASVGQVASEVATVDAKINVGPLGDAPAAGGLPDGSIYAGY